MRLRILREPNHSLFRMWRTILAVVALTIVDGQSIGGPAVIEGKDGWLFPGWESLTKADRAELDTSIALIRYARDRLAERQIGLVVLVVPVKVTFYEELLPSGISIGEDVKQRYNYILSGLEKAQIATIDDRTILKDVEKNQQVFHRTDYHWTSWAAEATAANVAALIKKNWQLKGRAGSGDVLGEWTTERQFGDLAANFLTQERRQAIGRDTYVIRKPAKAAGQLIQEDFSPVHIVGDSFVQPYFGFPQKLSNALDRPVTLNWQAGDVGPWATFLEYVESLPSVANRPQLIVWEFGEGRLRSDPSAVGEWNASSVMPIETWRKRVESALGRLN